MDVDEKVELKSPEDVGVEIASALLGEIELGGVVDSTHQVWVLHKNLTLVLFWWQLDCHRKIAQASKCCCVFFTLLANGGFS